jgi:hypothetical protein
VSDNVEKRFETEIYVHTYEFKDHLRKELKLKVQTVVFREKAASERRLN